MRFTAVILSAALCFPLWAQDASEEKSDEALVLAAEQLIAESQKAEVEKALANAKAMDAKSPETKAVKESDIPVFMENKKEAKSSSALAWRLVASLGFIAVIGGALMYAAKRWTRQKDKGGQKARIEILHQYHLGPRKSLALIRVSGEAMLVGVTEQNINMLKPITLIDDELERVMGADFNNFLEDEFSVEDVRKAIGPRA